MTLQCDNLTVDVSLGWLANARFVHESPTCFMKYSFLSRIGNPRTTRMLELSIVVQRLRHKGLCRALLDGYKIHCHGSNGERIYRQVSALKTLRYLLTLDDVSLQFTDSIRGITKIPHKNRGRKDGIFGNEIAFIKNNQMLASFCTLTNQHLRPARTKVILSIKRICSLKIFALLGRMWADI